MTLKAYIAFLYSQGFGTWEILKQVKHLHSVVIWFETDDADVRKMVTPSASPAQFRECYAGRQ